MRLAAMTRAAVPPMTLTATVAATAAIVALFGADGVEAGVLAASAAGLSAAAAVLRAVTQPVETGTAGRLALVAWMWIVFAGTAALVIAGVFLVTGSDAGAGQLTDPWSLFFETSSATSTTGLTMIGDPSTGDPWLQWMRSLLQWLGAVGVVMFAVLVAEPSGDVDSMVEEEWGDGPGAGARSALPRIAAIYLALTTAAVLALVVVGEPVWRAVNHGLTASATGGFTITERSAAASGAGAQVVLAAVVLISAVSFGTLWDTARRRGNAIWNRTQVRYGVAITSLGVVASVLLRDDRPVGTVVFDSISASTTAGFSIGSTDPGLPALGVVAMVSMLIGGAAGSTAGGVKVARIGWLAKMARRWLPGGERSIGDETPLQWDGQDVDAEDARRRVLGAAVLVVTWVLVVVVGTVVLAANNRIVPVADIAFDVVSATSGVGLSSSFTDAELDAASKATLSLLMLAGRVEITAFLVLLVTPVRALVGRAQVGP